MLSATQFILGTSQYSSEHRPVKALDNNENTTGVYNGNLWAKGYIAPTGAIILHPGDNISALVSAAPTGTTFYFEPGVYRGVSLALKDGQAFIGAEGAILNGSAVLSNWTQSGNL